MTSQELHDKMVAVLETLTAEHNKPAKAAHGRARKAAAELKKLAGEYKKASTLEDKAK
jgi:hypothetical protein